MDISGDFTPYFTTRGGMNKQTEYSVQVLENLGADLSVNPPVLRRGLIAKAADGAYYGIVGNTGGELAVYSASGLSISKGDVSGTSFIHKFGNAPDFDTSDGSVSIWDGASDAGIDEMTYTYSATADIDSLSSSSAGDTQDIEVQGLDSSYNLVTQTITLTGQTRVALTTDLIRVFRLKNVGSTNLAGTCYCFVNGATTGGVPNTTSDIRAIIQIGNNQTLMSIYTIPNGKTGYMSTWFGSTAGANKSSNYIMDIFTRPFGQVFQLKHRSSLNDSGNSYIQHRYVEPEIFSAKTDIEMRCSLTAVGVTLASVSSGFDLVLIDD